MFFSGRFIFKNNVHVYAVGTFKDFANISSLPGHLQAVSPLKMA